MCDYLYNITCEAIIAWSVQLGDNDRGNILQPADVKVIIMPYSV